MSFPEPPRTDSSRVLAVPPHVPRPDPVRRVHSPLIASLGKDPDAAAVAAFWARVEAEGTPLREEVSDGSCTYTFVHRGSPATRRVALLGNKIADPSSVDDALFDTVEGTDIWWHSIRLGSGWRASYAIAADTGAPPSVPEPVRQAIEQRRERSLAAAPETAHARLRDWYDLQLHAAPDPLARRAAPGSLLPSVAEGPEAPAPLELTEPEAPGTILPVPEALSGGRQLWWHVPAGLPPAQWDVLVLLDGERWLERGAVLDAWQASGVLPPTVTLLVGSGGMAQRTKDLTCSPELIADLVRVLEETPAETWGAPLTDDPHRTRIAGQSLGGLTALYAQCQAPERFGVSVCQSGSFWWPNSPDPEGAEWLTRAIRESGTRLATVALEVGLQEWVLRDPTRRLRDVLQDRCASLTYREFDGGHDEACWTVGLPALLRSTVPG